MSLYDVIGQGRCDKHGQTFRVLNDGFGGCTMCKIERQCESCKGWGIKKKDKMFDKYQPVLPVKTCFMCGETHDPLEAHKCDPCPDCGGTGEKPVKNYEAEAKVEEAPESVPEHVNIYRAAILKAASEMFDLGPAYFQSRQILRISAEDLGIKELDSEKVSELLTEFHSMFHDDVFSPGMNLYDHDLPFMRLTPKGMKLLGKLSMSPGN